ncbi:MULTISPECIES: UrcA family protein [unclassified Sphingobium]|uniref:UrcA family protein n=1 Tax=unclassified Sphingobium TaxID=2611147 RepID=UPI002225919D|nr:MULTISPECIES: UrcA family protein [unclassified Sphingobium]MCW2413325.1 UrcA family protein [Sphingobium sp. B8D3D]MCW2414376.1 UrcA family protein [Sphingobium sp. B8D3A]
MKKIILVAAAALLSAGSALAGETAPDSSTVKVSTAGLDLSQARDLQKLQTRMDNAIADACTPHGSYFATLGPERDCRAKLNANANQVLASLKSGAAASRLAEF